MNPWKIVIFFVSVFGLLLVLSIVFPKDGISLGEEVNLRFASSAALFAEDSSNSQYTDSLIQHATVTDDPEFGEAENLATLIPEPPDPDRTSPNRQPFAPNQQTFAPNPHPFAPDPHQNHTTSDQITQNPATSASGDNTSAPDTESAKASRDRLAQKRNPTGTSLHSGEEQLALKRAEKIKMDSMIRARIDSVSRRVYPIEVPQNMDPALYTFFEEAERSQAEGRLLRILHYGDSQIENDRMTALLRNRLQQVFGGSGCGMVPAIPLYHGNPTFRQDYSGDWIRYTGFGRRDPSLDHSSFGMMACFTAVPMPDGDGLPYLEFRFLPGRRASTFSEMKIYLHSYVEGGTITVHYNDTISDTIGPLSDGYQEFAQQLDFDADKVRLEFNLQQGGRIYGISFDPDAGIQMDNIAMRGSSGLEFSRSDPVVLDTMLEAVDPRLIIMQFGGNVVPYISNYDYYRRRFIRELNYLRSLTPETAIVVIGPGDMSMKENGRFVTYHTLEPVRDALRDAAHETGCAFWDMYAAMGGRNSIQNFVRAQPPLASPDYIHFTPRGANLMAGMFFDAVMLEYGKYNAKKRLAANEKAIREHHDRLLSGNPGTDFVSATQK